MKLNASLAFATGVFSLLLLPARADILYFQNGITMLWSSPANWYESDGMGHLIPAGRIPVSTDTAVILGKADAQANDIQLNTLDVQPAAEVDNGAFIVQTLLMSGGGITPSTFSGSSITIDAQMNVLGSACILNGATLIVTPGAFVLFGTNSTRLFLSNGALVHNEGGFIMTDQSGISCGAVAGTTNRFDNRPGGTLSSSGTTFVAGSSGVTLFDNSGGITNAGGTLSFSGFSWLCTNGTGRFQTVVSNATILFSSTLNVDPGITFVFIGPGPSIVGQGASVRGTIQVGSVDAGVFSPGIMNTLLGTPISGTGSIHVLSSNGIPSSLTFSNTQVTSTTITIDSGAKFNLIGGTAMTSNTVNDAGVTLLTGNVVNLSLNSATFNNLTGAVFQIAGDAGISAGGSSVFNNAGTLRKTPGSGTSSLGAGSGLAFNNTGLLDVQSGSINLFAGTSTGQFNTADGTTLQFAGGIHALNSGASFSGTGSFKVDAINPTTLLVNGNVPTPNLELGNGAIIDGPGQLTVNGPFAWNSGTLQGSGALNLTAAATTKLSGPVGRTLDQRTINNSGTTTWTNSGTITANNGAVFNNLAGALFDIQNDSTFSFGNVGTRPVFNNAGTLRKSNGSGTTFFALNLTNSGSVLISTQTVTFQAAYMQTAGTTLVNSGATLNDNQSTLNVQGGLLAGAGTINAVVNNFAGTVNPGLSPGILAIGTGNTYTQSVAGALSVELGGLTAGTQYDQLTVSGAAVLGGSLNVSLVNGFVPTAGQQFTILTCASRSGTFPVRNGTWLGGSLVLVPVYSNTNVVLVASNVTVLQPVISVATVGSNLQLTWPSVVSQPYQVEYSSDLFQWFVLSNLTANATSTSVIDLTPIPGVPKRFYRLR